MRILGDAGANVRFSIGRAQCEATGTLPTINRKQTNCPEKWNQ